MNIASKVVGRTTATGRLEGRTAIITGGANGMGRAAARMFAQAGARVAIFDIQAAAGKETAAEIEAAGGEALFLETDVTDTAAVRASFSTVAGK
jgi:NAD(P)-dependent dehydrogenase (short-subunit alcohol dehydrogenase family)